MTRWVDALAVTTVTGMLVATFAMLVVNRLLPADLAHRGDWEKGLFWFAWLVAFAHAAARGAPASWREQCWAVAMLAIAAVLLNWVTTGDHLLRTIAAPYWPVAGLDCRVGTHVSRSEATQRLRRGASRSDGAKRWALRGLGFCTFTIAAFATQADLAPAPTAATPRYTFTWPLDADQPRPRGGVSRGAPVVLHRALPR